MKPIHVLISTRVTAQQLERMQDIHPRLVIDGEPGGIAVMEAHEVDFKGIDYPEERPDLDVTALLSKAEVIIATRIPPYLGERAPGLRWIQFTSAGVDHLWKPFLDSGEIQVTNAKGLHAIPMAEFVLSGMLMFAKDWPRLARQQREHRYEKFMVDEIYGKTVVLVGVGEIGSGVARVSKQLGMTVIGVRRREGKDDLDPSYDEAVTFEQMEQVIGRGDFVVASLPLTTKTDRMVNEKVFKAMRDSAVFINVGRGKAVDEASLIHALDQGWIRGAVLDVFENEPLSPDNPLWDMPNVLVSPHMSSDTSRYMERMTDILCENLRRYAVGETLQNLVDPVERY